MATTNEYRSFADTKSQAAMDGSDGHFSGEGFVPNDWEQAAMKQRDAAIAQRRADNMAYRQQIGDFNQRGVNEITERQNAGNRAILAAADLAMQNGGMTPLTSFEALSNDIGQEYAGSAFRGKGRDMRFVLFRRDVNGRPSIARQFSMEELRRMDNDLGGGNFSDNSIAMSDAHMSRYMTPQQMQSAIGNTPALGDSIRSRVTGAAGGREIGSTHVPGWAASRLFGIGGGPTKGVTSVFASDGRGGFSTTRWNPETGQHETVDYGTRDPNYQGRWRSMSSGRDGQIYENDKTGERVHVKPGENLRDVLSGTAAKERMLNKQHENDVALQREKIASAEKIAREKNETNEKIANQKQENWLDMKTRSETRNALTASLRALQSMYNNALDPNEKESIKSQIDAITGALKTGIFNEDNEDSDKPPRTGDSVLEDTKGGDNPAPTQGGANPTENVPKLVRNRIVINGKTYRAGQPFDYKTKDGSVKRVVWDGTADNFTSHITEYKENEKTGEVEQPTPTQSAAGGKPNEGSYGLRNDGKTQASDSGEKKQVKKATPRKETDEERYQRLVGKGETFSRRRELTGDFKAFAGKLGDVSAKSIAKDMATIVDRIKAGYDVSNKDRERAKEYYSKYGVDWDSLFA